MRDLSAASDACLSGIRRELLAGRTAGWSEWRAANHADVTERTFWRLLKRAKSLPSVVDRDVKAAVSAVTELAKMTPADAAVAPPPESLRRADADGPVQVIQILRSCLSDCEVLRAYSLGPSMADGSRSIRNPTMFAKAADIKIDLVDAMVKLSERALDLDRMKQLFDVILTEIGKESPDLQFRVMKRFHGLDAVRGYSDYTAPKSGKQNA